jgi:hypothetical protein
MFSRFSDLMSLNIMLDAEHLFPQGHHPIYTHRTPDLKQDAPTVGRTEAPPRYYLIDFGLSRTYGDDYEGPWPPQEEVIRGGDKSVPEHQLRGATGELMQEISKCDPFPTDIYYLGHLIQEGFLEVYAFGPLRHALLLTNSRRQTRRKRTCLFSIHLQSP